MTLQEIREHFQWLVDDDTLDEDREVTLANVAYDALNAERSWRYLDSSDTSDTVLSSTLSYAVPADFLQSVKVVLFDGSKTYVTFSPVPYRERLNFKDAGRFYYVDQKNSNLVFLSEDTLSAYVGWTIIHEYQYQPEQLADGADEPVFNRAFHPILAYQMAKHYFFNDQGEKSRAWNAEFQAELTSLRAKIIAWDSAMDFSTNPSLNSVGAFDSVL